MTKNFLAMLSAMGLFTTVLVAGCNAPLCGGTGECLVGDVCVKPFADEKGMCSPDRCADSTWNTCPAGNTCTDIGKAQPLCFPPGTPADPCATDNGGCGSPDAWDCLWQTSRVQCLPKGSVKCTADDGSICSVAQYCDLTVEVCRTRIPVGVGDCARDRMCAVGATCNTGTKKCEGVPTGKSCTGDSAGQGCDVMTEFCNVTMSCEAKRGEGAACTQHKQCVSGQCEAGKCSVFHNTNCGSNSITFTSSDSSLECYGLVGSKRGELVVTQSGELIPAPVGTAWDSSGNWAKAGSVVKYCAPDWGAIFTCKVGTGLNQKWLVTATTKRVNGVDVCDPTTLKVDTTVWTPPAGCRAVCTATGPDMLCDK